MPGYNSIAVTGAQHTPQVPCVIPGMGTRVWDNEGFNGNAIPWYIQGCSGKGFNAAVGTFKSNNAAASTILVFVNVYSFTTVTDPVVTDTRGNTYTKVGSSTGKTQVYLFSAPNVGAGANTITATLNGFGIGFTAAEYGGTPTSAVTDGTPTAATTGYSPVISGTITTTAAKELIVAGYYNGMGRAPYNLPSGYRQRDFSQSSDFITILDGPARTAGAYPLSLTALGGDNSTLMMTALKSGTITASNNLTSQQVVLPWDGVSPHYFSVVYSFSADPGVFELDIMASDVDDITKYVLIQSVSTGLNSSFAGRTEVTGITAKFVCLVMKTITNAVLCTADIFA